MFKIRSNLKFDPTSAIYWTVSRTLREISNADLIKYKAAAALFKGQLRVCFENMLMVKMYFQCRKSELIQIRHIKLMQ